MRDDTKTLLRSRKISNVLLLLLLFRFEYIFIDNWAKAYSVLNLFLNPYCDLGRILFPSR